MSHFKAKMHQIIFTASARPSLRWSLTLTGEQFANDPTRDQSSRMSDGNFGLHNRSKCDFG